MVCLVVLIYLKIYLIQSMYLITHKHFKKTFLFFTVLAPLVARAQGTNLQGILKGFLDFAEMLVPIAFGLGLLAFFWGLAKYVYHADSDEERKKGKSVMIWGIVAIFVMASLFGIIAFLQDAFVIQDTML